MAPDCLSHLPEVLTSLSCSLDLGIGAAVRLEGSWVPSPGAQQTHELLVASASILGPSDAKAITPTHPLRLWGPPLKISLADSGQTFPLQKKWHSPEYLRTIPHLRARAPFNSALLRLRSDIVSFLNSFFSGRDFVQTHPPLITSSDCEGAGEVFTVSPARQSTAADGQGDTADLFFRSAKYLTVSSQLHLEALAQSLGNVWTLSPTFRAERSDTSRHLSEFYMLEAEMGFVDHLDGVMDLLEDLLRTLSQSLHGSRTVRELLQPSSYPTPERMPMAEVLGRWEGLMQPSWPRLTYTDAVDMLTSAQTKFEHKPKWGHPLQAEHEKYIADTVGRGGPVFVTHYPRRIKPFYMPPGSPRPGDASVGTKVSGRELDGEAGRETADCFDLLIPDFCEIAGGSMREHRLPQLLDAMRRHGVGVPTVDSDGQRREIGDGAGSLDWYVDLRRWGCPPHGGFGLGFDRLLCYLSGVPTVRDVVAFPRWYGRCDC